MYNSDDKMIRKIKGSGLEVKPEELEIMSFSESYDGKSDKEILQTLVDLDLFMKRFFFSKMRKSKDEGREFFRDCHQRMKKKYEFLLPACSNDYERNKLNVLYKNSLFYHEEFYTQSKYASKNPLITVLMPTFNSENYIAETLWSVFDQTCPDFEVLIVDEAGSSPETAEVISLFEDDRIRLVRNDTRLGLAESLNEGIRIARGKYIARIDADDLAREDRFELQANFLEKHSDYGLCGSRQHHFGVDNDFVHEVAVEHEDIKVALIYGCEVCHSTIMIRKDLFLNNNLFYDNTKKAEDYELWTRAIHKFKFHNLKEVLGEYRIGADNITKNKFNALSAESAEIASNNLSKYLHVDVPKMHVPFLTGWENRFEEVDSAERKLALKVEESVLREMAKNNLEYKEYKDSSLLMAINRRWRWVLGKYSYGHDLEKVLTIDELFKEYPIDDTKNTNTFSLKECIKKVLRVFYSPFKHGMKYRIRRQIWDLDGHLNDSKNDILNHMKDSEVRLKQYTYQVQESNNVALLDEMESSFKRLEEQIVYLKDIIGSQSTVIESMIDGRIYEAEKNLSQTLDSRIYKAEQIVNQKVDSRIYELEKNLSQTFDSRVYKAEQIINQKVDSRIYEAEKNLSQTFDSRIYETEKNLSQTFDSRVWKSDLYLKREILSKIWVLNRMLAGIESNQKKEDIHAATPIYGSNFYEDNQYGSYMSAIEVFKYLLPLYNPQSIVDFGCGTGTWLAAAKQINRNISVLGLDGDYVDRNMLMVEKEEFSPIDLTKEIDLHRRFDMAMSLEVAEHLDEKYADTFIDTLCRHSDIVLFSAAHVGQGGDGHVNEQPISYWRDKFEKRDYVWHDIRDVFKNNYDIEQWYKDNISIFIREKI